jgi:hypothetical protein
MTIVVLSDVAQRSKNFFLDVHSRNPPRPINVIGVTLSLQNGLNIELGAADEKPPRRWFTAMRAGAARDSTACCPSLLPPRV